MTDTSALTIQKERQKAALDEMSSDLKKVYKQIKSKTDAISKNVILAMYDVGELVQQVTRNERKYGEAAVPTLAVALGKQWSANQLWDYRQLANSWTRAGIEKLVGQKTAGGNTITLTHLKKLSGISDTEKRREMTKRVFVEDLTTDELADAILSGSGGKKRSSGGRKPTPPKTITSGLKQIASYPEQVGNRVKIWDTHVFNKIAKLSPDDCDAGLLKQLKATRDAEQQAIENSQHIVGKLDQSINRVETVLKKKKAAKKGAGSSNGAPTKKSAKKKSVKKKSAKKKPTTKKKGSKKKPVTARDKIAAAKKKRKAGRPAPT